MRAVVLVEPGRVEITEVPDPVAGPGEVLVRVQAAGVCQTDVHLRRGTDTRTPAGTVLGHEVAGQVVDTGPGASGWSVGDRVVVYPVWSCGTCGPCAGGQDNACLGTGDRRRTPPTPGVTVDGGMAGLIAVPSDRLIGTGSLDPAVAATLADAALSPYGAIGPVADRLGAGTTAVVIGAGGLGRMALQILGATTACRIAVVDRSAEALADVAGSVDLALPADSPGLVADLLAFTGGYGAQAVFDFVGVDATLALAADVVAPFGAIQVTGMCGGTLTLTADAASRLPRGASITPRLFSGTRADLAQSVRLAQVGSLAPVIIEYPFQQALRALNDLEAGRVRGRAVLVN